MVKYFECLNQIGKGTVTVERGSPGTACGDSSVVSSTPMVEYATDRKPPGLLTHCLSNTSEVSFCGASGVTTVDRPFSVGVFNKSTGGFSQEHLTKA